MIGLADKLLLTLAITQVACERSFSIKFINRLRSTLSQRHLEALMLMSLYNDTVINKVAETSALLRRSLTQEHLKAFITLHYIIFTSNKCICAFVHRDIHSHVCQRCCHKKRVAETSALLRHSSMLYSCREK